jgi:hypothetical protein
MVGVQPLASVFLGADPAPLQVCEYASASDDVQERNVRHGVIDQINRDRPPRPPGPPLLRARV